MECHQPDGLAIKGLGRLTAHICCLRIIDHRRAHVSVAQEFLNCANIIPVFKQVSREGMAQRMTTGGLEHTGFQPSFLKRSLQNRLMEMMPAFFSSQSIGVMTGCRKYPLPAPLFACVGIFSVQSIGQRNPA